jgi:hypothetical protein
MISNGMNKDADQKTRRMLPYFIRFVKFAAGFAILIAVALFILNVTGVA